MRVTDEHLLGIVSLANGATPGRWLCPSRGGKYNTVVAPEAPDEHGDAAYLGARMVAESVRNGDGAYIAAVNPVVVMGIVSELLQLRAGARHRALEERKEAAKRIEESRKQAEEEIPF